MRRRGEQGSPNFCECFKRVSFKGKDRTLRTFRLPFDSAYPCQSGLSPIGKGRSAPNAEIPVRIRGAGPVLRGGGRSARRLIVYQDQEGSTPFRRATSFRCVVLWGRLATCRPIVNRSGERSSPPHRGCRTSFCGVERDRTSALTFTQVIAGSIPAYPTGCEAHQDEQAVLTRQAERSIRSAPTSFFLG